MRDAECTIGTIEKLYKVMSEGVLRLSSNDKTDFHAGKYFKEAVLVYASDF